MQDARRINVNPSGLLLSLHPGPGLYSISNPRKSPGNETSSINLIEVIKIITSLVPRPFVSPTNELGMRLTDVPLLMQSSEFLCV